MWMNGKTGSMMGFYMYPGQVSGSTDLKKIHINRKNKPQKSRPEYSGIRLPANAKGYLFFVIPQGSMHLSEQLLQATAKILTG
jgi:hypothetical protein